MKNRLLVVSLVAILTLLCAQLAFAAGNISVLVNGKALSMDSKPFVTQGKVLVPMRAIFETLGASVKWDGKAQKVTAKKGDVEIALWMGKKEANVGSKSVTLDVAAAVDKGRTVVPLRFVAESLGAEVDWVSDKNTVVITTGGGGAAAAKLTGSLKMSGSTSVQPLAEELTQTFMKENPKVQITVTGGGSGVGISDAADGKVNIGNVSRALKDTDPKGLVATTIAKDAIVIVVNPKNQVGALTTEQVKKIFTGAITNWKEIGGKNAPILVNSRTAPSGTFDFFKEKFLGEDNVVSTAKQHASNGLVRQAVAANENAVGFISMGFVDSSIKAPKLDGVEPTLENAKNGTYKIVRPFVMVTKGSPTGLAKSFLDFVLSSEGQSIVKKEYISIK
jgi:phosphate transport system substrate-binding protein